MKKLLSGLLIASAVVFTSCEKEKMFPGAPNKPAEKEPEPEVVVPTNIVFRLVGDSMCCEYKDSQRPQAGWGEFFAEALGEGVQVANYAASGASTKSYIDSGKWEAMMAEVLPGDVVLIQLGHNDMKDDVDHGTTLADYEKNLTQFINDVTAKGAVPVLLTCVSHRYFKSTGALNRTHGEYPDVVRELAAETGTPLLDAEDRTYIWVSQLGEEGSQDYFVMYKRGADEPDNTHLTESGAIEVAKLIAKDLKKLQPWTLAPEVPETPETPENPEGTTPEGTTPEGTTPENPEGTTPEATPETPAQ